MSQVFLFFAYFFPTRKALLTVQKYAIVAALCKIFLLVRTAILTKHQFCASVTICSLYVSGVTVVK